MSDILNFTNLVTYRKAHELVIEIYKITKKFPEDERFCLVNQIRRAGISVTSNIAEGFARMTAKDKAHFYSMSRGSLLELQSQIFISKDLGYLLEKDHKELEIKIIEISKLISGIIKSARDY